MYNQFLENIILPLGDFINKSFYIKQLKYWRKVDAFTEKQLENLQKKNLQKVLKNAVQNVEKYKDIKLEGENPFTWLKQFPILTQKSKWVIFLYKFVLSNSKLYFLFVL